MTAIMGPAPSERRVVMRLRRLPEYAVCEGQPSELVLEVPAGQDETLILGRKLTEERRQEGKWMDLRVSTKHCEVKRRGGATRPWLEVKVLGAKIIVQRADKPEGDLAVFLSGSTAQVNRLQMLCFNTTRTLRRLPDACVIFPCRH